jgi:rhodanese-related sulfurtransferase
VLRITTLSPSFNPSTISIHSGSFHPTFTALRTGWLPRRSSEEITAAIGNSKCKPYNLAWPDQFQKEALKIPKDQNVILYCRSGARATRAAEFLNNNGYTNLYNAGGFMTWTGPTIPSSELKPISLMPEPSMRAIAKK